MKGKCKYPEKVQTLFVDLSKPEEAGEAVKAFLGTILAGEFFFAGRINEITNTKTAEKEKTLDVLVLNAGISQRDIFERTKYATAQKIMNINFMSCVSILHVSFWHHINHRNVCLT